MCDCFTRHRGIDCGSDGCHCHDKEENTMTDYPLNAKILVVNYFNDRVDKTDEVELTVDQVYIVWFSKTLQNWKALLSTTIPDGMYYELTHDGDQELTFIDAYKKFDNVPVRD